MVAQLKLELQQQRGRCVHQERKLKDLEESLRDAHAAKDVACLGKVAAEEVSRRATAASQQLRKELAGRQEEVSVLQRKLSSIHAVHAVSRATADKIKGMSKVCCLSCAATQGKLQAAVSAVTPGLRTCLAAVHRTVPRTTLGSGILQAASDGAEVLKECADKVAAKQRGFQRNMQSLTELGRQHAHLATVSGRLEGMVQKLVKRLQVLHLAMLPWIVRSGCLCADRAAPQLSGRRLSVSGMRRFEVQAAEDKRHRLQHAHAQELCRVHRLSQQQLDDLRIELAAKSAECRGECMAESTGEAEPDVDQTLAQPVPWPVEVCPGRVQHQTCARVRVRRHIPSV